MALRTKTFTAFALLLALSQVIAFFEQMIPLFTIVPGGKIGLANVVTMVVFCFYGGKQALLFGLLRCALSAILFQGVFSFFYSGVGTCLSVFAMTLGARLLKKSVSEVGLSMLGAAFFNVGQILVCCVVLNTLFVVQYLPVLLVISAFSGLVTGYIAKLLNQYIKSKNGVIK